MSRLTETIVSLARWFGQLDELGDLVQSQAEFLRGLDAHLQDLQPTKIESRQSSITRAKATLDLTIAHADDDEQSLLIGVSEDEITVSFGSEHVHFSHDDTDLGRVWPFDRGDFVRTALFFVSQLLVGRIRVDVYRRPLGLKTRCYWIDDAGEPELLLRGGTLLPVIGWSRQPTVEQISFV